MKDLLSKAIRDKIQVGFIYSNGYRKVEPHVLGYDKNGILKLRAYQVSGISESANPTDWKVFMVNDITNLQLLPTTFNKARPGYNHISDVQITRIISKL